LGDLDGFPEDFSVIDRGGELGSSDRSRTWQRPLDCVRLSPTEGPSVTYDPDVVLPTVTRALGVPRGAARWTFDPQS
jgi:hypothetical protein